MQSDPTLANLLKVGKGEEDLFVSYLLRFFDLFVVESVSLLVIAVLVIGAILNLLFVMIRGSVELLFAAKQLVSFGFEFSRMRRFLPNEIRLQ